MRFPYYLGSLDIHYIILDMIIDCIFIVDEEDEDEIHDKMPSYLNKHSDYKNVDYKSNPLFISYVKLFV